MARIRTFFALVVTILLSLSISVESAKVTIYPSLDAVPTPPCKVPSGIMSPARNESMCFLPITSTADEIYIREMGIPMNETLVETIVTLKDWTVVVNFGVAQIINYFSVANSEKKSILESRTVPISIRPKVDPTTNETVSFTVGMMVSTAKYPNPNTIPKPSYISLANVGKRIIAVKQFTSATLPTEYEFKKTCQAIQTGLPVGYTIDTNSAWSPTYAIYNGQDAKEFTNECWYEVNHN